MPPLDAPVVMLPAKVWLAASPVWHRKLEPSMTRTVALRRRSFCANYADLAHREKLCRQHDAFVRVLRRNTGYGAVVRGMLGGRTAFSYDYKRTAFVALTAQICAVNLSP